MIILLVELIKKYEIQYLNELYNLYFWNVKNNLIYLPRSSIRSRTGAGVAKVCIAKTEIKSKAINVIFDNIIVKPNTSIFLKISKVRLTVK